MCFFKYVVTLADSENGPKFSFILSINKNFYLICTFIEVIL